MEAKSWKSFHPNVWTTIPEGFLTCDICLLLRGWTHTLTRKLLTTFVYVSFSNSWISYISYFETLQCGAWYLSHMFTSLVTTTSQKLCLIEMTSFQTQRKGEKKQHKMKNSLRSTIQPKHLMVFTFSPPSFLVFPTHSLEFLLSEKQVDPDHAEMGQTKPRKRLCLSDIVLTISTDVNHAKWLWRLQLGRMVKMETRAVVESLLGNNTSTLLATRPEK